MARGSSWMKAKRARMASPVYRRMMEATVTPEGSKPCFARHETIGAANHVRAETQRLVEAYLAGNGKIQKVPCAGITPNRGPRATVCLGDTSPGRAVLRYGKAWNQ